MHRMSIRAAARTLIRLMSASAVRIALGAAFTTPQPAAAPQIAPAAQVEQTVGTGAAQAVRGGQVSVPGFACVGFGCG